MRRYLDIVAASMMLGLAFGRAGCLLNGCCFGAVCADDCPLGMRFPMYSKPLVKFTDRAMPFSSAWQDPSPVYSHQFHAGMVQPDERLRDAFDSQRLWPPKYLHGRLEGDQLAVLLDEARWQQAFGVTAGSDGRISQAEWMDGLKRAGGMLAGSENWAEAVAHFDTNGDGQLNWPEAQAYMRARRGWVLSKFDTDGDGRLDDQQRRSANAYLQEDLIALAGASRSLPVKPAQLLSMAGALLLTVILLCFYRLATLYPMVRFLEEGIRDQNAHDLAAGVLTHNQYEAMGIAAAGLVFLMLLRKLPPSCGPSWLARRSIRAVADGRRHNR